MILIIFWTPILAILKEITIKLMILLDNPEPECLKLEE